MNSNKNFHRKENPRLNANLISTTTFFYLIRLLKKGNQRDLTNNDIYEILPKLETSKLGTKIEMEWKKEQNKNNPSLIKMTLKCFGKEYLILVTILIALAVLVVSLQPIAISNFISHFKSGNNKSKTDLYIYGISLIVLVFFSSTLNQNVTLLLYQLGIKMQSSFASLIYRKLFKLDRSYMSETTIGQITTLITKDILLLTAVLDYTSNLWFSIVQIIVMWILIYMKLGYIVLSGFGVFVFLTLIMTIYYVKLYNARNKTFHNTRKRLLFVQEMLHGIGIIKMNCWESYFEKQINHVRKLESKGIMKLLCYKALLLLLGGETFRLCIYAIMITYVSISNNPTIETTYLIVSLFQTIQKAISLYIPSSIEYVIEFKAVMKQLETFLLTDEIPNSEDVSEKPSKEPRIFLNNISVQIQNEMILKNISMDFKNGLIVLTGPVGSGKTAILRTIFNDLQSCEGNVKVNGSISYAPQEPWVFTASIKQNILLGQVYNRFRYEEILRICALDYDIKRMENGDETIISENGHNLSTGQQARISLARAIYKKSDIYLLDDCFSVLDATISNFIFNECVLKHLKKSLTILITQNKSYLSRATRIIQLDQQLNITEPDNSKKENDENDYLIHDLQNDFLTNETDKLLEEDNSDNVYYENKKSGKVNFSIYKNYIKYGGIWTLLAFLGSCIGYQIFGTATLPLMTHWIVLEEEQATTSIQNSIQTNFTMEINIFHNAEIIKYQYTAVVFIGCFISLWYYIFCFYFSYNVSNKLHQKMINAVIFAKIKFFHKYNYGNILNRFSKDIFIIDELMSYSLFLASWITITICGGIVLLILSNYTVLIFIIIFLVLVYGVLKLFVPTMRNLKRLECITLSPIVGYVSNSLNGLDVIRASKSQRLLQKEFDNYQNVNASVNFMLYCTSRGFLFGLEVIGNLLVSSLIIFFMIFGQNISAGIIGLVINQVLALTVYLRSAIEFWVNFDYYMTSMERVTEFISTEQEIKLGQRLENWPSDGEISYENVQLSFQQTKNVLKNINFLIRPQEKICIVGRTGAGKSSIISSLFRIYDTEGKITIDNVDIKLLNLNFLRSKLAIIPQNPMLFTGTLRSNIDPNNVYSDEQIWNALNKVKFSKELSLDSPVTNIEAQFSSGEKQLLCMARILLGNKKIVVMDEATSNIDSHTECELSKNLKGNFANCTLIVIIHKLKDICQYDKVMVIDKGEIVEFDKPEILLSDKTSLFYKMFKQSVY